MATKVVNDLYHPSISSLRPTEDATEDVLYVEQELSPTQQAQARRNIGVAGASEVAYLGDIVGKV